MPGSLLQAVVAWAVLQIALVSCYWCHAGTDAGVSCIIYGEKGCTPQLTLENSANNFERGARDEFNVQSVDVGPMQRLQMSQDNRYVQHYRLEADSSCMQVATRHLLTSWTAVPGPIYTSSSMLGLCLRPMTRLSTT